MTIGSPDLDTPVRLGELLRQLNLAPELSVAVVNAPTALTPRPAAQPDPERADVVIGFVSRRVDLHWIRAVYTAAHRGRVAWIVYAKPGRPGTDLRWEWLLQALRQYRLNVVRDAPVNGGWAAVRLRPLAVRPESITIIGGSSSEHSEQRPLDALGDHRAVPSGRLR